MLEKPAIPDERICACLGSAYGLQVSAITFLPLGADVNTAVYRAEAPSGEAYFVKLRRAGFRAITVSLPAWLKAQGIQAVMAPLPGLAGGLFTPLGVYKMILYPYVEGCNAYEVEPSADQWRQFGAALRAVHSAALPAELQARLPRERFSHGVRRQVSAFLLQAHQVEFADPAAARLAQMMREEEGGIRQLLARSAALARALRARPQQEVPCHADIHAGNLHLAADGRLYIVDWDGPRLALREQDLALIGGCARWNQPQQMEWFQQGYGPLEINPQALAYYRGERVLMDIAAFCSQLFLSTDGGPDREQSLVYFASNFLPGGEIDLANATV